MRAFTCDTCQAPLHFENTFCLSCNSTLGFLPGPARLASLKPTKSPSSWHASPTIGAGARSGVTTWRMCHNYELQQICNWMIPADQPATLCLACSLNRTIPDLSVDDHRTLWAKLEAAKRRLIYSLLHLRLPLSPRSANAPSGLAFDFLADPDPRFEEGEQIMTGHADGVITINIAEADDAVREQLRLDMREVYRTLLGHFRHEVGHYYWDILIRDSPHLKTFRQLFGDERSNYAQALSAHYQSGPPPGWQENFVTPYASTHPWEDWAESWAHWLHLIDTLETAATHQLVLPGLSSQRCLVHPLDRPLAEILDDWHALRIVLNDLNRSMGLPDAYPFVISPAISQKLAFIHRLVAS